MLFTFKRKDGLFNACGILAVCCFFAWSVPWVSHARPNETIHADVCIYGGTSAGVIAAYTAARAGKKVVLVEPGNRLGGMSSGGLGYTDIGNKFVVKGLSLDFYRKLGHHYGKFEQWIFEPKVADSIFTAYMASCDATVIVCNLIAGVNKTGTRIDEMLIRPVGEGDVLPVAINAKMFIDCTYEGDLMAMAGASYHVGREDNEVYSETLNGVQLMDGHQFPDGIDPYVIPGDKSSGLVWGIRDGELLPNGHGDKKIQAYNYRITLTNVPENRIPITMPANYDPKRYELLKRQKQKQPWKSLHDVFIWSLMPNGKTDINNRNGFSTDMIGMNWDYPEGDYERRQQIIKEHEDYTKGLLYFVGNDPSVPAFIRQQMQGWGYPKDEYIENGHWSPQLYIRESRRLIGEVVMTQHHCQGREAVDDPIGYAAYTMDSHNCDRLVVDGMVKNEGNVEVGGFPPFPISYRSIVPKRSEVSNLLVPVCLSASHIAYGSIRMEPVFMVLAQAAGIAATLAIDQGKQVQQVNARDIETVYNRNPKGDGGKADVLIDSRNSNAVTFTGQWEERKKGGYGRQFHVATDSETLSTARFTAKGMERGKYDVYTYFPRLQHSASSFTYVLSDGSVTTTKVIDLSAIKIEGQTSGDWLHLGTIQVDSGGASYVEISNEGANGLIAANAVVYVPHEEQQERK